MVKNLAGRGGVAGRKGATLSEGRTSNSEFLTVLQPSVLFHIDIKTLVQFIQKMKICILT